jgi:Family of unknown function (DUF6506)
MAFTAALIAHSPDADPATHHTVIETGLYTLHAVVVRDQEQGLAVARDLVHEHGVQSLLLCPGHSNEDVGEIAAAVGEGVSVSVARGDPRGGRVAAKAMEDAGWFTAGPRG